MRHCQVRHDFIKPPLEWREIRKGRVYEFGEDPERLGILRREPQNLVAEPCSAGQSKVEGRGAGEDPPKLSYDLPVDLSRRREREQHGDVGRDS